MKCFLKILTFNVISPICSCYQSSNIGRAETFPNIYHHSDVVGTSCVLKTSLKAYNFILSKFHSKFTQNVFSKFFNCLLFGLWTFSLILSYKSYVVWNFLLADI